MVSKAAPPLWHDISDHLPDHDSPVDHGGPEQRPDLSAWRSVRLRNRVELFPEGVECGGASIPAARSGVQDSREHQDWRTRNPILTDAHDDGAVLRVGTRPLL